MRDRQAYRIAVGGVALGLVAFLIGAAITLKTGHTVPPEYWTAGSAISGALLGLLAPTPSTPKNKKAATAAGAAAQSLLHAEAAKRAEEQAAGPAAGAFGAAARAHEAAAVASEAVAKAPAKYTGVLPLVALLLVFAGALVAGIADNLTQLQSLAAAAGGALIGLIAPTPEHGA